MAREPVWYVVAVLGLLLAGPGSPLRGEVPPAGAGRQHDHTHHHDGSAHVHHHAHGGHDQPQPADQDRPEAPGAGACSSDASDHGCCCHHHHHSDGSFDVAFVSRQRDSAPLSPVVIDNDPSRLTVAGPSGPRQILLHARGRPPDHLVRLRTVVLLT